MPSRPITTALLLQYTPHSTKQDNSPPAVILRGDVLESKGGTHDGNVVAFRRSASRSFPWEDFRRYLSIDVSFVVCLHSIIPVVEKMQRGNPFQGVCAISSIILYLVHTYFFGFCSPSYFFPFLFFSLLFVFLVFNVGFWVACVRMPCLSYPVRWHGVALSTSFTALRCAE